MALPVPVAFGAFCPDGNWGFADPWEYFPKQADLEDYRAVMFAVSCW